MPVNMAISVVPCLDIPAQTCTESGCFGIGFGTEGSPSRRNCLGKNVSDRTVLPSVKTQSLNSSFCTSILVQKESRFSLFSLRIIWQYRVLVWTQPSLLLSLLITLIDTLIFSLSSRRFCNSLPLISRSESTAPTQEPRGRACVYELSCVTACWVASGMFELHAPCRVCRWVCRD